MRLLAYCVVPAVARQHIWMDLAVLVIMIRLLWTRSTVIHISLLQMPTIQMHVASPTANGQPYGESSPPNQHGTWLRPLHPSLPYYISILLLALLVILLHPPPPPPPTHNFGSTWSSAYPHSGSPPAPPPLATATAPAGTKVCYPLKFEGLCESTKVCLSFCCLAYFSLCQY